MLDNADLVLGSIQVILVLLFIIFVIGVAVTMGNEWKEAFFSLLGSLVVIILFCALLYVRLEMRDAAELINQLQGGTYGVQF